MNFWDVTEHDFWEKIKNISGDVAFGTQKIKNHMSRERVSVVPYDGKYAALNKNANFRNRHPVASPENRKLKHRTIYKLMPRYGVAATLLIFPQNALDDDSAFWNHG